MDMDRLVNDQNIERYRRLASAATTAAERKILLDLLAEERHKRPSCRRTDLLALRLVAKGHPLHALAMPLRRACSTGVHVQGFN
jgi:hypothetical protein